MAGIGGLDRPIIEAMLRNLGLDTATRNEVENFLLGRKTTVTNPDEFSRALRSVTQDTEAGMGLETGSVIGEVLGALEGGLVIAKAQEIISLLQDLVDGGGAGVDSGRDAGRARGSEGGPTYGPEGLPAADAAALLDQLKKAKARDAKKGIVPEERKFRDRDPKLRQRPGQGPVEDVFEDVPLDDPVEEEEKVRPTPPAEGKATGDPAPPVPIPPLPLPRKRKGKKSDESQGPEDQGTTRSVKPDNFEAVKVDPGNLRPELIKGGTEVIDESQNRVPENMQNQEWVDFSFVSVVDEQNMIEMDNLEALGKIQFAEPMYRPRYVPPVPPPSRAAQDATTTPMVREIQLFQSFRPKFDPADFQSRLMRNNDVLSMEFNPQPYDPRYWGKQLTWNPV